MRLLRNFLMGLMAMQMVLSLAPAYNDALTDWRCWLLSASFSWLLILSIDHFDKQQTTKEKPKDDKKELK